MGAGVGGYSLIRIEDNVRVKGARLGGGHILGTLLPASDPTAPSPGLLPLPFPTPDT